MSLKPLFILILICTAFAANAQQGMPGKDTVLKGSTIEVIQSYKPQVRQVPKPQWVPQLPPADTIHPGISYEVPQQTLYYTYSSLPLRPLALGKDSAGPMFRNYVKIGGGNLSTIFVDAGIGGISGPNYETAIHLHHLSQKGSIENQQSAQSGIEADALIHNKQSDWHVGIMGERNQYNYYGYDHSIPLINDSINQVYTTIRACVDMENKDSSSFLRYHPAINASLYNAKFNTSETNIGFSAPLTFRFDSSFDALFAITGAITSYKTDLGSTGNNFIEFLPGFDIHKKKLNGHALLGVAVGKGTTFRLLPDLLAERELANNKMIVGAGWLATLRQNTYEQLTAQNPYISNLYAVQQTRNDEVFVNVRGSKGNHLTFSGRISWWSFKGLPTFLNDFGDQRKFLIDYQDLNALSLHAAFRYQVASIWSAGVSADLYKFSGKTTTTTYAWGIPDTKIKGDIIFMPATKFTVTAYLALLDGMYAKDMSGNTVKLNIMTDVGAGAEYLFISRLSAFVQVDNILNQKYESWYRYPAYGLNIYGGFRVKF